MNHQEFPFSRRVLNERSTREYCGGMGRTTRYHLVKAGTFPPGIALGVYARGWFQFELDQWNAAKASGATEDELRSLVTRIVAARRAGVDKPLHLQGPA